MLFGVARCHGLRAALARSQWLRCPLAKLSLGVEERGAGLAAAKAIARTKSASKSESPNPKAKHFKMLLQKQREASP